MKILTAESIRAWDEYTILHEPISSIHLMERAAMRCVEWMEVNGLLNSAFHIFCGKGNNGGDGLAIARLLAEKQVMVSVHILEFGHRGTMDFQANLARLHQYSEVQISFIQSSAAFPRLEEGSVIVDALLGSGLNRALEGVTAAVVDHINRSSCPVIAIDMPSGLFADRSSKGNPVVHAHHTLTFQAYKPALLYGENASSVGEVHILDIGLHPSCYQELESDLELMDASFIRPLHLPRQKFSHKGNFGHALLVAGSYGKIGAAILAARAALRSGAGLLTCHLPGCGYSSMQSTVPEAMVMTDFNSSFITKIEADLDRFDAIGVGPGIGTASETKRMLHSLLEAYRKPMVLDADALNLMATDRTLLSLVPPGSILTPHPGEFERLFGETANEFERSSRALSQSREMDCIIVLKGHHSFIAIPDGKGYFNSTGNAGMATAGSGDVLTGIITGLLAQGYPSESAALLGVYLHGFAGDLAATTLSMEAMLAGDITLFLGQAFLQLKG